MPVRLSLLLICWSVSSQHISLAITPRKREIEQKRLAVSTWQAERRHHFPPEEIKGLTDLPPKVPTNLQTDELGELYVYRVALSRLKRRCACKEMHEIGISEQIATELAERKTPLSIHGESR